jgi:hypothetical protein
VEWHFILPPERHGRAGRSRNIAESVSGGKLAPEILKPAGHRFVTRYRDKITLLRSYRSTAARDSGAGLSAPSAQSR